MTRPVATKRCPPLSQEKRAKPYKLTGAKPGYDGEPPEMRDTKNLGRAGHFKARAKSMCASTVSNG